MEVWKPIPSAPNWWASSTGRIRKDPTLQRMPNGGTKAVGVASTLGIFDARKRRYKQSVNGRTKWVAPLVCEAFHGTKPDGMECMHLDEDSTNNIESNLAWGTPQENQTAPKILALRRSWAGDDHPRRKILMADHVVIRGLKATDRAEDIAAQFEISAGHVRRIWRGETLVAK